MGEDPKYIAKTAIEHNGIRYEPGEEIPATLSPAQLHALLAGDAIGLWQEPEPPPEGDPNEVIEYNRERVGSAEAGEAVDAASLTEVEAEQIRGDAPATPAAAPKRKRKA